MTSWNYRVIRNIDSIGESYYTIEEVYYDNTGNPSGHTCNCRFGGDTSEELRSSLIRALSAFDKPVLDQMEDE